MSVAELVDALVAHVATDAGVAREAVRTDAVTRLVRTELAAGVDPEELRRRAERGDPTFSAALLGAITVGETFFFRHPEHFELVSDFVASRDGRGELRAWSAGCATGEEAYSLAACLSALAPLDRVEVLGTDLLEENVAIARRGRYRRWSIRESAPLLWPVVRSIPEDAFEILEHVRKATRFERHNLLDTPAFGQFDIIFCRNVLIYFTERAAGLACGHLASALKPKGVIIFGTMDLVVVPPIVERFGSSAMQTYRRVEALAPPPTRRSRAPKRSSLPPVRSVRPPPQAVAAAPVSHGTTPVRAHVEALLLVEARDLAGAERVLARLAREHPTYLPGRLEHALVEGRRGHARAAEKLARSVLESALALPPDTILDGPERLPASFYRESAEAYLRRERGRGP